MKPFRRTLGWLVGSCVAVLVTSALAQTAPPARVSPEPNAPTVIPTDNGPVAVAYDSPRATMQTYLAAITAVRDGEDIYWPTVLACFDLAAADIAPEDYSAKQRAEQLLEVIDRIRWVEVETLDDTAALTPGQVSSVFFPRPFNAYDADLARRFELEDENITFDRLPSGRWLFSGNTLRHLPSLHRKAVAKGKLQTVDEAYSLVLERYMPEGLVAQRWLNVKYWQWIGVLTLILLGVVLDRILRGVWRVLVVQRIGRRGGKEHADSIAVAGRPIGLFAMGLLWLLALRPLGLPTATHDLLYGAAAVWTVLAGTWAAWRIVDLIAEVLASRARRSRNKFDDILIPLIRRAVKIFIFVIGIIYAADALSIPIGPMIASLGIGGLAFAFAAKDTIENFFGSVAVLLDRPFGVGDWVVIDNVEGTVEDLGFRSTRIRTFYNSQVTVPNASLVRAKVDNYGRRKYRRWKTHLGVQYDTPPDKLIAFTEGIRELVRTHPYTRKDYYQVWMHQWSPSSMDVLLYIFFEVPDWNTELRERERLYIDIVRLADTLGVQFAFPTQTVHLYKEEHAPYATQHEPPTSMTDRRSMVTGLRAAQQIIAKQSWQDEKPGPVVYDQVGPTPIDEAGNEIPQEDDNGPPAESPASETNVDESVPEDAEPPASKP
ncbi:MAG: mechanosensitive ion channel family protein [Planctomycetota bacterium]